MTDVGNADIVKRLKITEGHLRKVREMVENQSYCIDVLQQSSAVQSALKKVDQLILEHHIRGCVTKAVQKDSGEEVIQEILEVFSKR